MLQYNLVNTFDIMLFCVQCDIMLLQFHVFIYQKEEFVSSKNTDLPLVCVVSLEFTCILLYEKRVFCPPKETGPFNVWSII